MSQILSRHVYYSVNESKSPFKTFIVVFLWNFRNNGMIIEKYFVGNAILYYIFCLDMSLKNLCCLCGIFRRTGKIIEKYFVGNGILYNIFDLDWSGILKNKVDILVDTSIVSAFKNLHTFTPCNLSVCMEFCCFSWKDVIIQKMFSGFISFQSNICRYTLSNILPLFKIVEEEVRSF